MFFSQRQHCAKRDFKVELKIKKLQLVDRTKISFSKAMHCNAETDVQMQLPELPIHIFAIWELF